MVGKIVLIYDVQITENAFASQIITMSQRENYGLSENGLSENLFPPAKGGGNYEQFLIFKRRRRILKHIHTRYKVHFPDGWQSDQKNQLTSF